MDPTACLCVSTVGAESICLLCVFLNVFGCQLVDVAVS